MSDDDALAEALAEVRRRIERGEPLRLDESDDPALAGTLRRALRTMRALDGAYRGSDLPQGASDVVITSGGVGAAPSSDAGERRVRAAEDVVGRYTIVGEIARGGVGRVLEARDAAIGRDVAVKVLRDEHACNPDVVQRFIEEAQIAGQLQHPGIVPVYEMGVGRAPWFAMKLVRGRTLAALLAERPTIEHDRPRFVRIFESVCQTVAYAHARGVIHRDLKPSNVMIGPFGEVLVVDWGMGKVLRAGAPSSDRSVEGGDAVPDAVSTVRSVGAHSVVGSILGTPCYMPPEQARGDVVDERADVFALGAILCEVLTGAPPYGGSDATAFADASSARLEETLSRLDGCGAEPELVALARSCLAPSPMSRSRDAGVVAKAITAHLASVDERARSAQLEATAARVKAEEERRRRRLAIALAASILAFAALGGGGWAWTDARGRARADAASSAVSVAIDEATLLQGRAVAAPGEVGPWREATSAARKAVELARAPDAVARVRDRAAALLAQVSAGERRASSDAERRARDDAFVAELDTIRLRRGDRLDDEATATGYATAFAAYLGAPLDDLALDEVSRRLPDERLRRRMAFALDDWIVVATTSAELLASRRALVLRLDPDPWRRRLRETHDLAALRALASDDAVETTPVESVLSLAVRLGKAGDAAAGAALAERAWERQPDDFWAAWTSATLNEDASPSRRDAAVRFYSAAIASRPASAVTWNNLGALLRRAGALDRAEVSLRTAIRLDPTDATAHHNLGLVLFDRRDVPASIIELREAIRLRPTGPKPWNALGNALRSLRDFEGARAAFREAIRLAPSYASPHHNLGNLLVQIGETDGAIEAMRHAARLGKHASSYNDLGALLRDKRDLEGAAAALRESIRIDPTSPLPHFNLGHVLRDQGDLAGALAAHREATRVAPDYWGSHNSIGVLLERTGDRAGAIAAYREAVRVAPKEHLPLKNLAAALRDGGSLDEALSLLRAAALLAPREPDVHHELGLTFEAGDDVPAAIDAYREAARIAPDFAQARGDLGRLLASTGQLAAAIVELRAAARLAPKAGAAHTHLANALRLDGDLDGAVASFARAWSLARQDASTLASLEEALGEAERFPDSLAAFPDEERSALRELWTLARAAAASKAADPR